MDHGRGRDRIRDRGLLVRYRHRTTGSAAFTAASGTAGAGENARLTAQIALPREACEQVFGADSGYARSVTNLGRGDAGRGQRLR
ncbi:hypothetical protein [Nocardia grenadensis]|uniref:hypothetical protein n=1 Tax=Nocardia grenadensis TaxID=931537 RepID=UPI003D90F108